LEQLCTVCGESRPAGQRLAQVARVARRHLARCSLVGQYLYEVRCRLGEGAGHGNQLLKVGHDRGPQREHALQVRVGPYEVLTQRSPLTLQGAGERRQRGVELSWVQLGQEVIEAVEGVLQGGGHPRRDRRMIWPGRSVCVPGVAGGWRTMYSLPKNDTGVTVACTPAGMSFILDGLMWSVTSTR